MYQSPFGVLVENKPTPCESSTYRYMIHIVGLMVRFWYPSFISGSATHVAPLSPSQPPASNRLGRFLVIHRPFPGCYASTQRHYCTSGLTTNLVWVHQKTPGVLRGFPGWLRKISGLVTKDLRVGSCPHYPG